MFGSTAWNFTFDFGLTFFLKGRYTLLMSSVKFFSDHKFELSALI